MRYCQINLPDLLPVCSETFFFSEGFCGNRAKQTNQMGYNENCWNANLLNQVLPRRNRISATFLIPERKV
jgi:hypothetical protein